MRILNVVSSVNPDKGGVSEAIKSLSEGFVGTNIVYEVVSFDDPQESVAWETSCFKIFSLGLPSGPLSYNSKLIPWFEKNNNNYDLIIIHCIWSYHSYATFNFFYKKLDNKVPIYIMPHGMLDPWFQKDKTRRFKAIRNSIYWHLIEKKVINKSDGLLFACVDEMLLARKTFNGYHPQKEHVVGLGIKSPPLYDESVKNAFNYSTLNSKKNGYILFFGRIHPKKGVDILIEAYAKLHENFKENIPDLLIAGPGLESSYGNKMFNKAKKQSNISGYIHFPGLLIGNTKWSALYGCKVFVLASHQENFGIAVAEALSCGKPVIISDKVNIYREIQQKEAGIIINDTTDSTYNALLTFMNFSPEKVNLMSENAVKLSLSNFNVLSVSKNYLTLLKNIKSSTKID